MSQAPPNTDSEEPKSGSSEGSNITRGSSADIVAKVVQPGRAGDLGEGPKGGHDSGAKVDHPRGYGKLGVTNDESGEWEPKVTQRKEVRELKTVTFRV